MIYTTEEAASRGYVYRALPPPRYPRPQQQRARSPGASASGAGPSTAVVAANAAAADPPMPPTGPKTARQLLQLQREQHLSDDELLSVMMDAMEDGGFAGMLGDDQKRAIMALRGGKQLTERERTSTYFAADDRMLAINIKLDEMDLKLANSYSVHSSSKIDMIHVKARVLAQVIWGATGNALVDVEEGQTTRSPRAWAEVAFLTGASTIKYARDCAAEVIGASVAWRLCAAARPTLMAEYAAGDFSLDAFMRVARKVVSIRLSFTQASGLTPKDARITMNHNGIFDWDALVEEAITASAERLGRGRKRTQRLRELVLKMHAGSASARATITEGLQLTAEQVDGALPTEDELVEPLPDELAHMLAPNERTLRPTREDPTGGGGVGTGTVQHGLPAAAAAAAAIGATTAATAAAAATTAAALATTTPPPRAAAAAAARRIAGTAAPATAATTTAAAGAKATTGRRGAKRVASAGQRGARADAGAADAIAPCRRQRVVGPSVDGDGGEEAAADPRAALVGGDVLELSPAVLAAHANAEGEALDVPAFVAKKPASTDNLFDFVARVPPGMVGFAIRLLRAAEGAGLLGGSAESGRDRESDSISSSGGGGSSTAAVGLPDFFTIAEAYDDAVLLVHTLDRSGGQALASNRALIKGDRRLLGMGLGPCFTSFSVLVHGSSCGGSSSNGGGDLVAARAAGTTAIVLFIDPEHVDGGDEDEGPHAYELVFSDGLRIKLWHGMVLVSVPGGKTWHVERVAGAGDRKMVEMHVFASGKVVELVCSPVEGDSSEAGFLVSAAAADGFLDRLASRGNIGRREVIGLFC